MREIEKQDKIRLKEIKIEEKRWAEEITTRKINQTKRDRNATFPKHLCPSSPYLPNVQ
jgi:hypothetical protein